MRYVAVTRGISSVNLPRIIYLRAVVISILVEWGVVIGSPILVWGPAVATLSTIGWGKYSHGDGGLRGIAYGEG